MSELGFSFTDLGQLRRIGVLLDEVLVGRIRSNDTSFRLACDELRRLIAVATTSPPPDLQGLVLSELLGRHFKSGNKSTVLLLDELQKYSIGEKTQVELEALAQAIERDKVAASTPMGPLQY